MKRNSSDNKTHKTALVLIPPQTAWPAIQAIRQQYDEKYRRWMPHVTLVYPFRPRPEFDEAARKLAPVCEQIAPVNIKLATFNYFQHRQEKFTLWLAPEPKEALIQLQSALVSVFPDCDDVNNIGQGFTPHLSVGQIPGRNSLMKLQAELQQSWQPIEFVMSEIALIWRNDPPDDVFRVHKTVKLG